MDGLLLTLSQLVVAAALAVVAWQDWNQRIIANWAVGILLVSALLRWLVESPNSNELMFNLIVASAIAVPGLVSSTLGAGDVKLLYALSPLWTTDMLVYAFSIGILTLIVLAKAHDHIFMRWSAGSPRAAMTQLRTRGIPLGTAIALGAAISAPLISQAGATT